MKYFILFISIILGLGTAIWSVYLQSDFLKIIGVSPWGAITLEPILIVCSFLIGIKISKWHKFISSVFLILLFVISFATVSPIYLKNIYTEIKNTEVNQTRIEQTQKTEDSIRESFDSLSQRGLGAKNTLKIIDKLQKQQEIVDQKVIKTELNSIIEILTTFFYLSPRNSTFLFSILISLSAVFSPAFLFFSSGLVINQIKEERGKKTIKEEKKIEKLTDKQKSVLFTYNEMNKDISKTAKVLNLKPRVIKSQLSKIADKIGANELLKPKNEIIEDFADNIVRNKPNDKPQF